jgi:hypothetical protein
MSRNDNRIHQQVVEEVRKLVAEKSPQSPKFRLDFTLTFVVAVMAVLLVLFPPQEPVYYCAWLATMCVFGIYPALHLAEWIFPNNKSCACVLLVVWVAVILGLGAYKWPPIKRHLLDQDEKISFESTLKSQKDGAPEIQIACPANDETTCAFAGQFITMFGEADWRINTSVSRLVLTRPQTGVVIYLRGGDKQYSEQHWNAGGWFPINEPHVLAIQKAFQVIHIEIDSGTNPELADGVMTIYFGPERADEEADTNLKVSTEWAEGKRFGPYPGKSNTRLCRWFGLLCG